MPSPGIAKRAVQTFSSLLSKGGTAVGPAAKVGAETVAGSRMGDPAFLSYAAAGGLFLTGQVGGSLSPLMGRSSGGNTLVEQSELERQAMLYRAVSEGRAAEMERSIAQNIARVAAVRPDLYASVAAGRRLPRGARIIGGQPRQDLLLELGRAMAEQEFAQRQENTEDIVTQYLGGS